MKIYLWFIKWIYHWLQMVDGIIGIITLGAVSTKFGLAGITFWSKTKCKISVGR